MICNPFRIFRLTNTLKDIEDQQHKGADLHNRGALVHPLGRIGATVLLSETSSG